MRMKGSHKLINLISFISNCYRGIVLFFFIAILTLLVFYSAISTSMLVDFGELTFFVSDSWIRNIAAVLLLCILIIVLKENIIVQKLTKRIETCETIFDRYKSILLLTLFGISALWVLCSQSIPDADQYWVQQVALELDTGNLEAFRPGAYMSKYQNQHGILLLSWLFGKIFGFNNYTALQLLNCVASVIAVNELQKICGLFGWRKTIRLLVICVWLIFFPIILYCSFVYGTLVGLALSLLAIRLEIQCVDFFSWKRAIASAGSILFAMLIKTNYLIFFIAMLIYSMIHILQNRKLVVLLVMFSTVFAIQLKLPTAIVESVTGIDMENTAMSDYAWIAMGMLRGQSAPGWFNSFSWESYNASNYNTEIQEKISKDKIQERIEVFKNDLEYAIDFYTGKIASQWNEPTFQAFWNIDIRDSAVERNDLTSWILSLNGEKVIASYLNIFQFLVYFGALLCGVLGWKQHSMDAVWVLPLIFIGGVLFHIMWEAKAQYAIPYFMLLLPFSVDGYDLFTNRIVSLPKRKKHSLLCNKQLCMFLAEQYWTIALLAVAILSISRIYDGGHMWHLTADNAAYEAYLGQNTPIRTINNGEYYLQTENGDFLSIKERNGETELSLSEYCDIGSKIEVKNYQNIVFLRLADGQWNVARGANEVVTALAPLDGEEQRWTIEQNGNGVWLCQGEKVLTFDIETQTFSLKYMSTKESYQQRWFFIAVENVQHSTK